MSVASFKPLAKRIVNFWYGGALPAVSEGLPSDSVKRWYMGGAEFDEEIRVEFGTEVEKALEAPEKWPQEVFQFDDADPEEASAAIIVLDQFTRNLYRDDPTAFAADARALALADHFVANGTDVRAQELHPSLATLIYHPFMHSENLEAQNRGIALLEKLTSTLPEEHPYFPTLNTNLDYFKKHRDVIEQFGRFPHRNDVLGRTSTPEEIEAVANGMRF
ncbi:MAG: hypothetical protein MHM6MM_003710 [Cercozoa sp. M6MM]